MHVESSVDKGNDVLSESEIRSKLEGLPGSDLLRLDKIAKKHAWQCPLDPNDLLHQAIVLALDGSRRCPRDVSLIAFLAETMRSIAFNEKRKAKQKLKHEAQGKNVANDSILAIPDTTLEPSRIVEARSEIKALFSLFEDDDDVTMLLMGLQDGYGPDEICEMNEWDRKTYNAIRKRLRRRLNKLGGNRNGGAQTQ